MLKIQLLGPPLISWNDEFITIPRRAARALLFYLAAYGKPIDRAQLSELFWPDEETVKQRGQMRSLLGKLREALPRGDFVQTYHDTVSLDFERVSVDMQRFRRLTAKAGELSDVWPQNEPLPAHIYQQLSQAAELWYGAVFIHSADMSVSRSLEQWWTLTASDLEQEYIAVLKTLIQHENTVGANFKALQWLQDAFTINDLDEELHYTHLNCLLKTGQLERARRHYLGAQALFRDRLDSPLPESLQTLEPTIFQQTEAGASRGRPGWSVRPSINLPFVGQREALTLLRQVCLNGGATLVMGEAGSGKTRLVQEFYQRLDNPPRLLLLPCYLLEEYLPYQPWIDMLRNSVTEAEWRSLPPVWAQPLAALMPDFKNLRDDLVGGDVVGYASTAIFEAIKNLLRVMAQSQPLLLFMDDAHWADEASLSLLAYLIRQSVLGMERSGLVITSRIEEENEALQRMALNLQDKELKRINLSRLNETDTADLALYALRQKAPKTLVDCLLKETGGNTFLLLEMLRAILAMPDREKITKCDQLPVSADMEKLLRGRLQNLSDAARDVLYTAAIQGSPFDLMTLEKAVSLSVDGLISAVEELEQAQLIRNVVQSPKSGYIFVHELLRDALIADLSEVRKRALHKKVAEALETLLAGQTGPKAAILAQHYTEAREFSLAFDYWVQAGLYAYQLFSVKDATLAYQHAEYLIPQTVLQDRQIYELYAHWSDMAFDNDDADLLETLNRRFLELGKERGSDLLIGTALDGLSDACMARNQFAEGLEYTRKAIPYLELSGNVDELMTAHSHSGVFLYMLSRFDAAEERLRIALTMLQNSHEHRSFKASGDLNYHLATVSVGMGWPNKGVTYAERSLRELSLSRWPYGPVMAHSMLGLANYYRLHYETGRKHSLKSVALAKRIDGWRMLGYAYAYAGMNETELALLGPAWNHAQKAIEIGLTYNHPEIVSMGYKTMGDIYARLSAHPQAAQTYQQGVRIGGETFMALENLHRLGVSLALVGNPDGETMLERAINEAQAVKLGSIAAYARALRLSLYVAKKEYALFDKEVASVAENLRQRTNPDAQAWTDYLKAAAALQRGNAEKALRLLEALKPIFKRTPMFWIELRALAVHAQALRELKRDATNELARIEEMLAKIENTIGEAPLESVWQNFRSKTQRSLAAKQ